MGAVCPQWFEAMEQDIDNFLSSGSTSFKFSNDCHNLQVYPNITLLTNHFEHICWLVNYLATPFDAYLPIGQEDRTAPDLCYSNPLRPDYNYCKKKLKEMVQNVQTRKDRIQLTFFSCQLHQFRPGEDRYHVVHCSDAVERIGLANILPLAYKFLLDEDAVLVLEIPKLPTNLPSVSDFVEFCFRCPISMMPTMYGFRLANHVQLGSPVPVKFHDSKSFGSIKLLWHKAPSFSSSIKLAVSAELHTAIILLSKCCFIPSYTSSSSEKSQTQLLPYSPLTFYNVIHSLVERCAWIEDYFHLNDETSR